MANQDIYGSFGSVQKQQGLEGSGAKPLSVSASPEQFGSQIGAGLQRVGAQGAELGNQAMDYAQKQQDMINETAATETEIKYASELAGLSAGYESLSGLAANNALPEYTKNVTALRQKYAEGLSGSAQKGFETLAMRHERNALIDANKYAAIQVKKADFQSAASSIAMSVAQAGYIPVANDDYRFGETLGDIHANVARQFSDATGIVQDPKTGYFSFSDTPEAKKTEQEYNKSLDEAIGNAWTSRFNTLANEDPIGAFEKYNNDKDEIPSQFQVALDAFFYPRVRDAYADGVTAKTINTANDGYSQAYAESGNVSPIDTILKNELHADGVIRVHDDNVGKAIGGINSEAFPEQFAKASDILNNKGQDEAKKYIKDFYQKEIIEKNGIDKLPKNVQDIVADGVTNHRSEIQKQLVDAAENGATRQELINIRRKEYERLAATGEKKYVDAKEGWDKRLNNLQRQESGMIRPPTNADYYKENYEKILNDARLSAEDQRPGDDNFAELAEKKTKNYLDGVISQQGKNYELSAKNLYKATTGALTNGQRPISMDAIKAINPAMKSLVDDVMVNQPQVYNAIDKQLRTLSNANKPKIPLEEQNRVYTEMFDEVASWQLSTKKGKVVFGKEDVKTDIEEGNTSSLADLMRIQQRIMDESNRGVKGLNPLMKKITPAILNLVGKEQGYDDEGWTVFGGEALEPYDVGYQVIQDYLSKPDKEVDLSLKARMLSNFVRMADAIPVEIQQNPVEYNKVLAATADFVISDVFDTKVPAARKLSDTPNFAYKDGELVEGLPGKRDLKPDSTVSDLEVKMQVDNNGNKAKVYFKDGKRVKAEILDKEGKVAKEVMF